MIPAKPTALGRWFWQTTARIGIRQNFHKFLLVDSVEVQSDKSVILVGNHISWWDGFFAMELNRRYWRKNFYVMMLEEQLKKRPFMRQTGAFSVNPGARDVVNTINYASDLLRKSDNLLLIFPQGKIHSQYDRSFQFGKGLQKISSQCSNSQLVFFASFLDYGAFSKPTVRVYTQVAQPTEDLGEQYSKFFKRVEQKHIHSVNE